MNSIIEKLQLHYEQKRLESQQYAQKSNAKNFVIQKMNSDLRFFHDILEELISIKPHEQWKAIDQQIAQILKQDQNLGGVHIMIRFNNGKEHFGWITSKYSLS